MSQIATPRQKIPFYAAGTSAQGNSDVYDCFGGYYAWHIEGTFGSGTTVQLQYLGDDGVTWQNLGAARTTNDANNTPANSATMVLIAGPTQVRLVIAVANPTSLYSSLNRVP